MGKAMFMLLVILALDVSLLITNESIRQVNPNTNVSFFECQGNILSSANANGCEIGNYTLRTFDKSGDLPNTQTQSNPTGVNVFVDAWQSITNFFSSNPLTRGLGFLIQLPNALGSILATAGLPDIIVFAFGSIWFILNVYLILVVIIFRGSD